MLETGKLYRAKTRVTVQVQSKEILESFKRGEMNYFFSQSVIIPEGDVVLVLETRKTTFNILSKVLHLEKIYNYFYNKKHIEEEWVLVE